MTRPKLLASNSAPSLTTAVMLTVLMSLTGLGVIAKENYGQAASGDYYVNPNGSDTAAGTASAPFKTIQHGLNIATPGTTINLQPGIYHEMPITAVDGTASAPITIKGPEIGKDPSGRYKAVLYGTGRVISVNNSYYVLDGFTIDGEESIPLSSYPTALSSAESFKNSVASKVTDGKLIYVGAADTTHDLTGVKINNMFLNGAGGECVRIRNRAVRNEVSNSVIQHCGLFGKPSSGSYTYHNGEGVYIGTSPSSTTQPMHANDTSNNNLVHDNILHTYGSECVDIKENAYGNRVERNDCGYNDEPGSNNGSNIELRGHDNYIGNNIITQSRGYGLKMATDSTSYTSGGNSAQNNSFSAAATAYITNKQATAQKNFCGNTFAGSTTILSGSLPTDPKSACAVSSTPIPPTPTSTPVPATPTPTPVPSTPTPIPTPVETPPPGTVSDTTPPSTPVGLTATPVSASQVNLTWSASTDNVGVTGYDVYRDGTKLASVLTTSFGDSGLTTGTSYRYAVAATDAAGNVSQLSPEVQTATVDGTVLGARFEAESGTIKSPMRIKTGSSLASGNAFIEQVSSSGTGTATYHFNIAADGSYKLAGRVKTKNGSSNSFYYSLDGQGKHTWHLPQPLSNWTWANGPTLALYAGPHTLVITKRETSTKLDELAFNLGGAPVPPPPAPTPTPTINPSTSPNPTTPTPTPSPVITPSPITTPSPTPPPGGQSNYAQVLAWVDAFAATHTGKATDINHPNASSYNEPAAQQLRSVCGAGLTSVYPRLAWEYGGVDHAWINPSRSPLLICVHNPVRPPYSPNWSYVSNHVTAVVYTKFPAQSPCADKLLPCMLADSSNFEILVDEAGGGSTNGSNVGIDTSIASTELLLQLSTGTIEHLWNNL